jgi:hypothetical protein
VTTCSADARWLNTNGNLNYYRSAQVPTSLSLLAHVSRGSNCSYNAEVSFTATYLTDNQDFICSGTIRQAMTMSSEVQTFNIEVRPFTQTDFLRWRNQPGVRGIQAGKRLVCTNLDGTADVGDIDRQRAAWVRISVGVLPVGGGIGIADALIRINP